MPFDSLYPRITKTRRIQSLDGMWDFMFGPAKQGQENGWHRVALPQPVQMPVPSSFADLFTDKMSREFCGDMWYQTMVFVPGEWRDGNVDVRFDAATHRAEVYLNGEFLVSHEGGFTPFCAHLNSAVKWNDWNVLSVKVNNELSMQSLPLGITKTLRNGTPINLPYFDFFNYSGLQRSVRMLYTPATRIEDLIVVTKEVEADRAVLSYKVETNADAAVDTCVEVVVLDEDGSEVARVQGASGDIEISSPRLWNLRDAYLYTVSARIVDGDEIVDEYFDTIGIRTVSIEDRKIKVNGRPIYLKGFGRHEDSPMRGRGFDPVTAKRDFEIMKWMGCNSFRTSHYPYAEEELYLADREGFFVIDEVAAVGMLISTTNYEAATQKAEKVTLFDAPDIAGPMLKTHLKAIDELVARDKNHASVCAWSLFNEPDFSSKNAVPYATEIFEHTHEIDPQNRPCSYSNVTRCRAGIDVCTHLADFMMLNRYDGWYVSPGPEISDAYEILIEELHKWETLEPNKPFVFTEYGCDTVSGVHKLPSVMWSEDYQREYFELQHKIFDQFDWIVGEQPWNLCDFQTVEGRGRVDGNKKGAFTRDRQPKAVAYVLRDRWLSIPDYTD